MYRKSNFLRKDKKIHILVNLSLFKKAKKAQLRILQKEGKSVSFGHLMRLALIEYLNKVGIK